MEVALTPRMKNWLEGLGAHVATAPGQVGVPPTITVVPACSVSDNVITFALTDAQAEQVRANLSRNNWVAVGPGALGAVRAPYQFKGRGVLRGNDLVVTVSEIYCTKPGPEASVRLDTLGYEAMRGFDESRWMDLEPPRSR